MLKKLVSITIKKSTCTTKFSGFSVLGMFWNIVFGYRLLSFASEKFFPRLYTLLVERTCCIDSAILLSFCRRIITLRTLSRKRNNENFCHRVSCFVHALHFFDKAKTKQSLKFSTVKSALSGTYRLIISF